MSAEGEREGGGEGERGRWIQKATIEKAVKDSYIISRCIQVFIL